MSQEKPRAGIDVPSRFYYYFARAIIGRKVSKQIIVNMEGFEHVPLIGGVMAVSNHRNNKWDVPILGEKLAGIRTPYYPAKEELDKGVRGRVLRGSGALFFVRDNRAEAEKISNLMLDHIRRGHMILTMVEGTSKNRGQQLQDPKRGALDIALRAELDEMVLFGLAGTETDKTRHVQKDEDPAEVDDMIPSQVHIEVGTVSLLPLAKEFRQQEKDVPSKEQKEFMREVIIPSHQQIIDAAYEKLAA